MASLYSDIPADLSEKSPVSLPWVRQLISWFSCIGIVSHKVIEFWVYERAVFI